MSRHDPPFVGTLWKAVKAALTVRDEMRTDGASESECASALEEAVRASWPHTREWKFICEDCSDTGWRHGICTATSRCGRPFRLAGQRADDYTGRGRCSAEGHSFVAACWCAKGREIHRQLEKIPNATDDLAAIGKVTKPSRFGR